MFENKLINGYVYATRFIASWLKVGDNLSSGKDIATFRRWLESIGELSKEDINDIINLATNGRLELQEHAKEFIKNNC